MLNYFWVGLEKSGGIILRLITMIILARYLSPQEFGTIAVLVVFVSISNVMAEAGLGGALIRKKVLTELDKSTVFIFNFCTSLVLYSIIWMFSPIIEGFYGSDDMATVIRYLALIVIIKSFALVPNVLIVRNEFFKVHSKILIFSNLLSSFVAIVLAINGVGLWSLVALYLCEAVISTVLILLFVKPSGNLHFSISNLKVHLEFGFTVTSSNLLNVIYNNFLSFLIATSYGVRMAGFYYQANQYSQSIANALTAIIDKVSFNKLARAMNDPKTFKSHYEEMFITFTYLGIAVFSLLAFISQDFIVFILGSEWSKSGEALQILCIAGMGILIDGCSRSAIKASGLVSRLLKVDVYRKIIGCIALIVSVEYGFIVLVYTYSLITLVGSLLNLYLFRSLSEKNVLIYVVSFLIMSVGLSFISNVICGIYEDVNLIVNIITKMFIFTFTYTLVTTFLIKLNKHPIIPLILSNKDS
ncbi:lipopolysaccharide biosynthesis protein [Thalassotalea litorea]|uniref:lipopolysaccharide biosynthesis protein n=1 Tax=Thalassotalea litorea TaxID=2020715 RepID=UPI0037350131